MGRRGESSSSNGNGNGSGGNDGNVGGLRVPPTNKRRREKEEGGVWQLKR